jgi:tetratricopeptide (TPR) repeat protein
MKRTQTNRFIYIGVGLIAGLAVVVVLGPQLHLFGSGSGAGRANPYEPYISFEPLVPLVLRGATSTAGEQYFNEGMGDYGRGNYNSAVKNLKLAVRTAPDQAHWWLYLGVSYFLDRQPVLAVSALERADFLASPELKPAARWYLAQAYLLAAKPDKALPMLAWVSDQKAEYATRADSLSTQIRTLAARN